MINPSSVLVIVKKQNDIKKLEIQFTELALFFFFDKKINK